MYARFISILIATWVLVAAFAWEAPTAQFVSMVVVALLVMAVEALAFFSNSLRFVNTALGAWLLLSGFVLPTNGDFLLWNNFFCGVTILVLSMVRSTVRSGPWIPHRPHREGEVS